MIYRGGHFQTVELALDHWLIILLTVEDMLLFLVSEFPYGSGEKLCCLKWRLDGGKYNCTDSYLDIKLPVSIIYM